MRETAADPQPRDRLTRRSLLAAGGAGVAALWLGPEWTVIDGVAEAATRNAELRRSGWLQSTERQVRGAVDGRRFGLYVESVEDLPIAVELPALRDHDAAFAVGFVGPAGLPQGSWSLDHAELGAFPLFVVPVGRAFDGRQHYEAVIDRTVMIAGVTDLDDAPGRATSVPEARTVAPERTEQPVPPANVAVPPPAGPAPRSARRAVARPRVRRVTVTGRGRRSMVTEIVWANAGRATAVHGLLMSRGRVVARAGGRVRRLSRLRMRLTARGALRRGRYELRLTVVDRGGRVTRIRRTVRVP
jgi:hypothetical protein